MGPVALGGQLVDDGAPLDARAVQLLDDGLLLREEPAVVLRQLDPRVAGRVVVERLLQLRDLLVQVADHLLDVGDVGVLVPERLVPVGRVGRELAEAPGRRSCHLGARGLERGHLALPLGHGRDVRLQARVEAHDVCLPLVAGVLECGDLGVLGVGLRLELADLRVLVGALLLELGLDGLHLGLPLLGGALQVRDLDVLGIGLVLELPDLLVLVGALLLELGLDGLHLGLALLGGAFRSAISTSLGRSRT